jgi:NADH-quinone oxidoreductase subunit D
MVRRSLPKVNDDLDSLLTENRIFKQRTVDIGVSTREEALDWGLPGRCCAVPAWRGICVSRSLMMFTSELDFDIPVGKTGDCYARYLVRMAE